jgi:tRNA (pseudouridine54-N1)-methyltransferase
MKHFLVVAHKAVTCGDYSLNDMPGSAGRMDILCRCVSSAFFLSHDLRRDVQIHLLLLGEPHPGRLVRFEGEYVRYLSPDERSSGSLIKKALQKEPSAIETRSTPGVNTRTATLAGLLDEFVEKRFELMYLREDGEDLRGTGAFADNTVFILGDHVGVTEDEEKLILGAGARLLSVGPRSLHANDCITIIHNELDKREGKNK